MDRPNWSVQNRVDGFLFACRNTPHATTVKAPAELFLEFKPRTRITLLKPHLRKSIQKALEQKIHSIRTALFELHDRSERFGETCVQ